MSTCRVNVENEVAVRNLQAAFQCELNAHDNYMAFAAKADVECAFEAASLFRAIGRSEKIHADNHARVIRRLGGTPEADIHEVEVKTTLDNLMMALEEEVYEINEMYPRFLVDNRSTSNSAARTFTWALEAEKSHAFLLNEVITHMKRGQGSSPTGAALEFYVRPVCGYVLRSAEPERCWACEHFCKTFEIIR
jgi:rubrerythrin